MASDDRAWLTVFQCKEAYVYQVPPASTVGHRADLWNVNQWLSEVGVKVVAADEDCFVRLEDCKTGELFAECPVPKDAPLITVVEPVIDSSRYFVLRIVDTDTGRHAFVGLGFRERAEASNFNAALYEHGQYLKRKRVAEARRKEFEEREQRASESEESEGAELAPAVDYSIKPGEKITIKLNVAKQDKGEGGFLSKGSQLAHRFNLFGGSGSSGGGAEGNTGLALAPPPAAPRRPLRQQEAAASMCVSPRAVDDERQSLAGGSPRGEGEGGGSAAAPVAGAGAEGPAAQALEELQQLRLGAGAAQGLGQRQGEPLEQAAQAGAGAAEEDDDWGEFTSS